MAIRTTFTADDTGEVSPLAHLVVSDPVMDWQTQTVTLRVSVYASKAAYDAKKQAVTVVEKVFPAADYLAVRANNLGLIEPALISRFFNGGTRVAD